MDPYQAKLDTLIADPSNDIDEHRTKAIIYRHRLHVSSTALNGGMRARWPLLHDLCSLLRMNGFGHAQITTGTTPNKRGVKTWARRLYTIDREKRLRELLADPTWDMARVHHRAVWARGFVYVSAFAFHGHNASGLPGAEIGGWLKSKGFTHAMSSVRRKGVNSYFKTWRRPLD